MEEFRYVEGLGYVFEVRADSQNANELEAKQHEGDRTHSPPEADVVDKALERDTWAQN